MRAARRRARSGAGPWAQSKGQRDRRASVGAPRAARRALASGQRGADLRLAVVEHVRVAQSTRGNTELHPPPRHLPAGSSAAPTAPSCPRSSSNALKADVARATARRCPPPCRSGRAAAPRCAAPVQCTRRRSPNAVRRRLGVDWERARLESQRRAADIDLGPRSSCPPPRKALELGRRADHMRGRHDSSARADATVSPPCE